MIRDFIINKLGGMTKKRQEEIRSQYESWAIEHLTGKKGEVTPNVTFYRPFDDDEIIVIRSRIKIMNGMIKSLKVAPWCREVKTENLRTIGNKRELIE